MIWEDDGRTPSFVISFKGLTELSFSCPCEPLALDLVGFNCDPPLLSVLLLWRGFRASWVLLGFLLPNMSLHAWTILGWELGAAVFLVGVRLLDDEPSAPEWRWRWDRSPFLLDSLLGVLLLLPSLSLERSGPAAVPAGSSG